jgi:signal transduction histidine kinase
LRAARARIVAAGDAERQRLERDLHDGAQQRLVGLSLALRLARPRPGPATGPDLTSLIDQAGRELRLAIDELRDLAHGIYPAVLADEGLAAAVEALAERSPIPVTISGMPQERFPGPAENAGYFLITEATDLIAALPGTRDAAVDIKHDGSTLAIQITARAAAGPSQQMEAGLADAADRIGALGGHLRVHHAPSGVITIRAEIPCES